MTLNEMTLGQTGPGASPGFGMGGGGKEIFFRFENLHVAANVNVNASKIVFFC